MRAAWVGRASKAAVDTYAPGDLIAGRYRLIRKAGEGGMGAVWVATQAPLERQVAVKVVHPYLCCREIADRLLREARAAATLNHAAIVRVFDFGETERGEPYIVMELLAGEEMRDLLARESRLAPERAIQMLLPIANGLAAAHGLGIVHRDLKPENVVLAEDHAGRVQPKLVDFGIAKLTMSGEGATLGAGPVGTPAYMPPEQALCTEIDHRADIWSFCALVYEAISGRTPFASDGIADALRALATEHPRPLLEVANVDIALAAIVDRGLRRDRTERWQSMRDLGTALASWLVARGVREDVCGMSLHAAWTIQAEQVRPSERARSPRSSPARAWCRRTPTRREPARSLRSNSGFRAARSTASVLA